MITYSFNYRKYMFWKKKTVTGHKYEKTLDRMDLYLPDGGILSLKKWSQYDLKLGKDWVLALKKDMEKSTGHNIELNLEK